MKEETITITLKEYERLKNYALWADALEAAGVDYWDGWEEAVSIYIEYKSTKE